MMRAHGDVYTSYVYGINCLDGGRFQILVIFQEFSGTPRLNFVAQLGSLPQPR
jgi:hypothetical protein